MTKNNEQIIIDGVDVSGCPHYINKDGSCSSQDCECIKCIHNECFYKDYKRKEQECEVLKEENSELKIFIKDLSYENQKFCYQIEELTKQLKVK